MDNEWYDFNDSMVTHVSGDIHQQVVTPQAYVLFYKRRYLFHELMVIIEYNC